MKDELKNRISMALKDPILQQGFEIICKNLAELEKENAELKADNEARKFAMTMSEKVEKQLREENAELKKELKDANEKVVHLACNQNKDLRRKITKAKELIEDMYDKIPASHSDYYKDVMERARQFLKENADGL